MANLTEIQNFFFKNYPDLVEKNIFFNQSLKNLTTFKIGGSAEVFLKTNQQEILIEILKKSYQQNFKINILGGGSNILIDDNFIKGLTVKYENQEYSFLDQNLTTSSAVSTALIAKLAIKNNLAGLENFASLPGTIGGAIYNNSHYQQHYLGDLVEKIIFFNGEKIEHLDKKSCHFSYDSSIFLQKKGFILQITFKLKKAKDNQKLNQIAKATLLHRQKTQPLSSLSAGCVFKNPKNNSQLKKLFPQFKNNEFISAGFLIDRANLKGLQIGDALISEKHASFIINNGQASSQDVIFLIKKIQKEIKNCFDIKLETEIFYWQ